MHAELSCRKATHDVIWRGGKETRLLQVNWPDVWHVNMETTSSPVWQYFGFSVGESGETSGREYIVSLFHHVQPQVYVEVNKYRL